jgi:Arc/MetJ-type ribon-helix-helix transcriptional regulator
MRVTARLDVRTDAALKRLSARRGQSKSEVIRDAIARLAEEEEQRPSAYDRFQPFIGIVEGGDPKLSENTGKRLRELLEQKTCAKPAKPSTLGYL